MGADIRWVHRCHSSEQMPQKPNWITDQTTRMLVHKWRTEEQAIIVGTNTALVDNPHLNVRLWQGRNPIRIVLDRNLRLPCSLNLFDGSQQTLVITEKKNEKTNP